MNNLDDYGVSKTGYTPASTLFLVLLEHGYSRETERKNCIFSFPPIFLITTIFFSYENPIRFCLSQEANAFPLEDEE